MDRVARATIWASSAAELGCTGSPLTSRFQALSAGKIWHPPMLAGARRDGRTRGIRSGGGPPPGPPDRAVLPQAARANARRARAWRTNSSTGMDWAAGRGKFHAPAAPSDASVCISGGVCDWPRVPSGACRPSRALQTYEGEAGSRWHGLACAALTHTIRRDQCRAGRLPARCPTRPRARDAGFAHDAAGRGRGGTPHRRVSSPARRAAKAREPAAVPSLARK